MQVKGSTEPPDDLQMSKCSDRNGAAIAAVHAL